METLLVPFSTLQNPISNSPSTFNFRSSAPPKTKTLLSLRGKHKLWRWKKKPISVSFSASSCPASDFGGWDDLDTSSEHPNYGSHGGEEFEQLRRFLISIGIDDRKHVYLFLTGFASALAVSRVRFSSIAVFPASVLLFLVGFLMGAVRGGGGGGGGGRGVAVKNGTLISLDKQSDCNVAVEKLRSLREFLSELDVKMSELRIGMEGAIDSNSAVEIGEIERYHGIVESVRLLINSGRGVLENLSGGESRLLGSDGKMGVLDNARNWGNERVGEREAERNSNQKSSRRKREVGGIGLDFFQSLVGGLFQEVYVGSKPPNVEEETIKQESKEQMNPVQESNQIIVNGRNGRVQANKVEEGGSIPSSNNMLGDVSRDSFPQMIQVVNRSPHQNMVRPNEDGRMHSAPKVEDGSVLKAKKSKVPSEGVNRTPSEMAPSNEIRSNNAASMINGKEFDHSRYQRYKDDILSFDEGPSTWNNGLHLSDNHRNFQKMGLLNKGEAQTPHDDVSDQDHFRICQENGKLSFENGNCSQDLKEGIGKTMKLEDKMILNNHRNGSAMEQDETPSSSTIPGDVFNRHLKEANGLLKNARESLMVQADDEMTEILLCKSASLLSRALQIKPTSLKAVGQLGNVFLLHGELKLKKSRELRVLLSGGDSSPTEKRSRDRSKYEELCKEKTTSVLVDVCEECEELLIEAGRKYRMALSIDGNNVRALYNWGLALSFRAQLIADVGPEAALDADKVYLAAIDKFDAMASKSNAYAPDALFRWGVALQLRSQLRPRSSEEKLKLLYQAKRLLEDALHMDSDNLQIRKALSSCIAEIKL